MKKKTKPQTNGQYFEQLKAAATVRLFGLTPDPETGRYQDAHLAAAAYTLDELPADDRECLVAIAVMSREDSAAIVGDRSLAELEQVRVQAVQAFVNLIAERASPVN